MAVYNIKVYTEDFGGNHSLFFSWNQTPFSELEIVYMYNNNTHYQHDSIAAVAGNLRLGLSSGGAVMLLTVLVKNTKQPIFWISTIPYNMDNQEGKVAFFFDNTGKPQTKFFSKTENVVITNSFSDSISPGGLSTLHIDDTRVEQINYNGKSYTSFPVDIPLVPTVKTMTVIGKTFNVQLDNELNIVRVKDGQMEYRQFPATIMVGENKTLQLYGKEDPEITIDYTGTQDPVISNTPATPPPMV